MLFGPGADSGTFDYFTEAVNGKAKASRGDYTASEDDNTLVQGVENNKNALGYFGFAYYAAHKDKMTAVADRWRQGPGRARASRTSRTAPTARCRVRCSSTCATPSAKRPEVQGIRAVHADARRSRERSRATCRCRSLPTSWPGSTSRRASSARCSAACRRSASRSTSCRRWKASCNPGDADAGSGPQGPGPAVVAAGAADDAFEDRTMSSIDARRCGKRGLRLACAIARRRDRVVELLLLAAGLVAVFTTVAIVVILRLRVVVFLRARVDQGLPDRHDVDAAVRRRALRHPAARFGHADRNLRRAARRHPARHDHRDLPFRIRDAPDARDRQADPGAAGRRADGRLRLFRAVDGHAGAAETDSRNCRDSTC